MILVDKIESILANWQRFVKARELNNLLKLYTPDAVFMGVFSNEIGTSRDYISAYYKQLFARDLLTIDFVDVHTQVLGDNGVQAGIAQYQWNQDGQLQVKDVRFTIVYQSYGSSILICHQHASTAST